eukprot:GHVQ01036198.1.p1 GENE.GHVQ01036198.1~~GHVQ01036198.1.p1  ORF type:complete len:170 (+),score=28.95 GHVQ01036198.1:311-820(+)
MEMDSYAGYSNASMDHQLSYANTATAQAEQQTQVGPEWGQQFVDNFFQTQPAAQPMYIGAEYVNSPTGAAPPQNSTGQYYQYGASQPVYINSAQPQGAYSQQPQMQQASYGAGYYEQPRAQQGMSYANMPQFQAPQYQSYPPPGGSQVYMMPPVVKKQSASKKKKGMCC